MLGPLVGVFKLTGFSDIAKAIFYMYGSIKTVAVTI